MSTAEAWLLGELGSRIAQADDSVIEQLLTGGLPWATCGSGTIPGPGPSSEREGQNSWGPKVSVSQQGEMPDR